MAADDAARSSLRNRIAADLRPVRPLLEPWQRALVVSPLALLLLVALPLAVFHVRTDVDRLSPAVTWGLSVVQISVGLALVGSGFRQVVPGRWFGSVGVAILLGLGGAATLGAMWLTWHASPVRLPEVVWTESTAGCLRQSFLDGIPVLAACLVLAGRGLVARPALVGALAGLGAGVISDAAWRMVCVVTQPSHVFLGHFGAVVGLALAGAAAMSAWSRLRQRRRT